MLKTKGTCVNSTFEIDAIISCKQTR